MPRELSFDVPPDQSHQSTGDMTLHGFLEDGGPSPSLTLPLTLRAVYH